MTQERHPVHEDAATTSAPREPQALRVWEPPTLTELAVEETSADGSDGNAYSGFQGNP